MFFGGFKYYIYRLYRNQGYVTNKVYQQRKSGNQSELNDRTILKKKTRAHGDLISKVANINLGTWQQNLRITRENYRKEQRNIII